MDKCSCSERCISRSYAKNLVTCDRRYCPQVDGVINSCSCVNGACKMESKPLVAPI